MHDQDLQHSRSKKVCFICSVAKCLGAVRICEKAFAWTMNHNIVSHVVEDKAAVNACLRFLGKSC